MDDGCVDGGAKRFPPDTSIRCRSSTNNEDLPGFSGAGLYSSKTQHPDEGHLSKCIKQVFASTWNFRAFDERQFYRIDHLSTAMGVLLHPNYLDELANGVGVTTDPIYQTVDTYYLNTQIGEDLVTNPDALSIPEEILLMSPENTSGVDFLVRASNLVANGEQIMSDQQLDQLRSHLYTIHNEFRVLYNATADPDFAMAHALKGLMLVGYVFLFAGLGLIGLQLWNGLYAPWFGGQLSRDQSPIALLGQTMTGAGGIAGSIILAIALAVMIYARFMAWWRHG